MARKLKTYVTSIGFFDLAIAAPSMKAALEAWGAASNLFHQGFARETDDPQITAAALKHPGDVLKRPIGSRGPFKLQAEMPQTIAKKKPAPSKAAAALARKQDRERKQREARLAKAETALASAKTRHEAKLKTIGQQREALDQQETKENERWRNEQAKLEASLRKLR